MKPLTPEQKKKLEIYLKVKKKPGKYEKVLWEKTTQYLPYFSKIPGIRCICVCNSLAMNACHKDSDIDLFIITQKNRLWTVRICITLLLFILGQRKTAKHHAGKFCLSFFMSEEAMDFQKIAIENDIYLKYWIENLHPILNRSGTFEKFIRENREQKPHFNSSPGALTPTLDLPQRTRGYSQGEREQTASKKVFTKLGDTSEKILKHIFLPRTKKSFQKLGKPFGVIISDDMLKFHDKDRRKEIRDTIL